MTRIQNLFAVAVWAGVFSGTCWAQTPIVKTDPPPGTLQYGQVVLVDDGTCPKGKIKQVTGAKAITPSGRRATKCVPYPK
jgi:hypothetical protein